MLVLVANLGSTSFKFRLLDMGRRGLEIARGSYDRIGLPGSSYSSHAQVVDDLLTKLERPPDAIGFKAVQGGPIAGAVRVTDQVIGIMQQFADIAPAHNPPYIAAMKALRQKLPGVPQVAAFDSAFHQTIPLSRQAYAVPHEWMEKLGIRRYGFHGAFAPLYRPAHQRAGARRPSRDQLPSGRVVFGLRHRPRQVGGVLVWHDGAVGAAAQFPRGGFRRLRDPAPAQGRPWPRGDLPQARARVGAAGHERRLQRPARHRAGRRRRQSAPGWPSTRSSSRRGTTSAPTWSCWAAATC